MIKKLFALIIIFYSSFAFAETIKTDVLVIGNGPAAVAAAIQSSRSKLKTVLLVNGSWMPMLQGKSMIKASPAMIPLTLRPCSLSLLQAQASSKK